MKKLVLLLVFLNVLPLVQAQTWISLNSGVAEEWLRGVYFPVPDTGYVVGGAGIILRTTDAGATWQAQTSGVTADLNAVYFTSATIGYVCGDNGTILKTEDAGNLWVNQSIASPDLQDLIFSDEFTGYVTGDEGVFYQTTNGGIIWDEGDLGVSGDKFGIFLNSNSDLYVCGAGNADAILVSTDFGSSWQNSFSGSNTFGSIFFTDATSGFAASIAEGSIYSTSDAGNTWQDLDIPAQGGLFELDFPSAQVGYVVGGFPSSSSIYVSLDGGMTWNQQLSPVSDPLLDVHFVNDSVGYAVGLGGTILKTENGTVVGLAERGTQAFTLYPNPASDRVKLGLPSMATGAQVLIRNVVGQEVLRANLEGPRTIDISHLNPGIYLVTLNFGTQSLVKKLIVN